MFNAMDYATESSMVEITEGWTTATIDEIMQKQSQAGNTYVSVRFNLDQFGGRKLWENLNVCHDRDNVRDIAFKILANMCIACGFSSIRDERNPVELEGKSCEVYVGKDKRGDWTVKSYRLAEAKATKPKPALKTVEAIADEDIPF